MSYVNINSEIGKLKRVMLHRPSRELESLTSETMAKLLFDDIPYLKIAQREHDYFAETLRNQDVEVVYLEQYLKNILLKDNVRKSFVSEFVNNNEIFSNEVHEALSEYYLTLSVDDLIDKIFAGVRKDELKVKLFKLPDLIRREENPFWINPAPNLYFTRDPGAILGCGMNIHYMRKKARRIETLFLTYIHKHHPQFKNVPLWYDRETEFPIEGGDILVLSEQIIAIGYSERTSAKAIEVLAKKILAADSNKFNKILVFAIPKIRAFMHLDTVFTMVDFDKFTVHPTATGPMSVYELTLPKTDGELNIEHSKNELSKVLAKNLGVPSVKLLECGNGDPIISGREQWNDGSNTLAIAPGTVVVYDRNNITNDLLEKHGLKILEIPSSELSRGRGGPRCMSMPLYREDL
jgi:arginine deiminase